MTFRLERCFRIPACNFLISVIVVSQIVPLSSSMYKSSSTGFYIMLRRIYFVRVHHITFDRGCDARPHLELIIYACVLALDSSCP